MKNENNNGAMNFALIGCGRISQTHLQAIGAVPESRLKAAVDIRKKAARSAAEQYGESKDDCGVFDDYRKVVEDNHIDAVVICTPPNTHAEIASFFLDQGIHVLCEKPLAVNCEDAGLMVAKAEENGCQLMMASKFRYVENVIKAKGIVESGMLGEIILFENVFCSKIDMRDRWNSEKEVSGGGVLMDNGCHSVDIARYLLGPIKKVQAEEGKRIQRPDIEDTSRLFFRTETDVMGAIDLSWSIQKELESFIDIYGTEGVLSVGWKCSKYRQNEKVDWVKFGNGYDKLAAFSDQLSNFIGVIKGREQPLITAKDSLESVKVISAAYESMDSNKWIEIE